MPEEEAHSYQQHVEASRVLVMVESYGHQHVAQDILYRFGASDASVRPPETGGERIIPVREEVLQTHKQVEQTGEVVIRKEVLTEERTITVSITRDEQFIARRSGSPEPTAQPVHTDESAQGAFRTVEEALKEGGTLRIVLVEEQVRIEKYPAAKEEIFTSKRQFQETQQVSETLKREKAHFDQVGNVNIHGSEVDDLPDTPEQET